MAPWDLALWSERMRKARHAFDQEALRPYFPIDRVIAGLFELASRVFGLRVEARPAGYAEVWHPDVKFYDLFDRAGRQLR